ncbi:MAG: hypothetical protein E7208_00875 [Clostridium butyricum]|nr:hypothetical protein [Clostridium butyricum]
MVIILLILILLGLGTGFFFINKYEKTISSLRLNLMMTQKQLDVLIKQQKSSDKNFLIEFLDIDTNYGILTESSRIYLSPNSNSPCLYVNSESITVNIIEKALIDNAIWYYVNLPINSNINSKGWAINSSFSSVYNESLPTVENNSENILPTEES